MWPSDAWRDKGENTYGDRKGLGGLRGIKRRTTLPSPQSTVPKLSFYVINGQWKRMKVESKVCQWKEQSAAGEKENYDFFGSCVLLLFRSLRSTGLKDFKLLLGCFSTYSSTSPRSTPDTWFLKSRSTHCHAS